MSVFRKLLAIVISFAVTSAFLFIELKANDEISEYTAFDSKLEYVSDKSLQEEYVVKSPTDGDLKKNQKGDETLDNIVFVKIPEKIDFEIVTIAGSPLGGIVCSKNYHIVNLGEDDILVSIDSINLYLTDYENFKISGTPILDKTGNNIYVELTTLYQNIEEKFILSDAPSSIDVPFLLASGMSLDFRFTGTANQLGDIPWQTGIANVSMVFKIIQPDTMEEIVLEADMPKEYENDVNDESMDINNQEYIVNPSFEHQNPDEPIEYNIQNEEYKDDNINDDFNIAEIDPQEEVVETEEIESQGSNEFIDTDVQHEGDEYTDEAEAQESNELTDTNVQYEEDEYTDETVLKNQEYDVINMPFTEYEDLQEYIYYDLEQSHDID